MKRSEKIIFLLVIIGAIAFVRYVYPNISGVPSRADADQGQTASAAQSSTNQPTKLVLPQTTISATAPDDNDGNAATDGVPPAATDTVFTRTGDTPLPIFSNKAYMVADLTTGAVLAGSNVNARWPTASLTKLMTATLILDQLPTNTRITITPQMFSVDPDEYTLAIGGTYTVEDLLHLMLMPSSNVAAEAMADTIGHAQFMSEMNARAAQWGMTDTYFADTSGISAANESSASDFLILAQHIYQNYPEILTLTDTPTWTMTELNSGRTIEVKSINAFAGESVFVGGKTGNTPQAGGNLLSIFNYDGHPVLIVVLGAPALPFQNTSNLFAWFRQNYK
ncbi:MAG TPA: serine hydrolase [Candidatus Paceibacterota bacterium]|nr:serine hydrolase [Candidatus Paceibacterota bacterium]